MADRVVPVDVRAVVATWPKDAPRGAVTQFCRQAGISRSRFYEIRAVALAEGVQAAVERRPRSGRRSPLAIPVEVEEFAVLIRKELADAGWDHGPRSVRHRLGQLGISPPAASTLARVFAARGMVVPQPQKRPRSSYRRFEFAMVHECWQLDSFQWPLDDANDAGEESVANVYQLLDDKSRFIVASHVEIGETSAGAIAVLDKAISLFQVPLLVLSDNGTAFNQTRLGRRSKMVEHLQTMGCRTITGKPGHPQTQGKNERVHATTQRWLRARPRARTVEELRNQIDSFDHDYNHDRPHQSLGMQTPARALSAGPLALEPIPASPEPASTSKPVTAKTYKADFAGRANFNRISINLGIEHAHTPITVVRNGETVSIFDARGTLIRTQHLTPGQNYYGSGRPTAYRRNKP